MGTFHYEALDRYGKSFRDTIEAPSLYEASQRLRETEVNVVSLEAVGTPTRHFEPADPLPPPVPRQVPVPLKSVTGGLVLVMVGAIFTGVASVFVISGIALQAAGTGPGIFFTLFPLVHLGIGLAMLTYVFRRRGSRRAMYREGEVAMGTIEGVGYNRSVRVNGRNPYELVWSFEVDGKRFHEKRSTFNERVMSFSSGDRMWVIYDRVDPEQSVEWPPFE